jgi:hypothetical protein
MSKLLLNREKEDRTSSEEEFARSASFHRAVRRSYMDMMSSRITVEGTGAVDEEFAKMMSFHRALRRLSDDVSVGTSDSASRK